MGTNQAPQAVGPRIGRAPNWATPTRSTDHKPRASKVVVAARRPGDRSSAPGSSVNPVMACSGVRSSWLSADRKSDLARLADSATSRASSASRRAPGVAQADGVPAQQEPPPSRPGLTSGQAVGSRRSIRHFQLHRPVDRSSVQRIGQAARLQSGHPAPLPRRAPEIRAMAAMHGLPE